MGGKHDPHDPNISHPQADVLNKYIYRWDSDGVALISHLQSP